ncbi:MAG: hypothetical protein ACUZ8H_13600 [Candidatus Anammoxibacter sp.]
MTANKSNGTSIVIATGKSEAEYSKGLQNYEKKGIEPISRLLDMPPCSR